MGDADTKEETVSDKGISRRDFLRMGTLTAAGVALAGCAPAAPVEKEVTREVEKAVTATPAPPEPVTLRWGSWSTGGLKAQIYDELTAEFSEAYPNVSIQHEPAPWAEYWDRMQVQLAAGEGQDVLKMSGAMFLNLVEKGFLMNMSPFVETEGLDLDEYFPQSDVFTYEGGLYSWPFHHSVTALWYNQDLFDEAGVDHPPTEWENAWTWDEYLEAAQKLTKVRSDGRQQYGTMADKAYEGCWASFVWSNGGDVMNEDRTKTTLDTPEAMEAIQFVVDLVQKYEVSPEPGDPSAFVQGAPGPFESGLCAMWHANSAKARVMMDLEDFTPCACVLPKPAGGKPVTAYNDNPNSIAATCEAKDAAWQFVKWLASREGWEEAAKLKVGIPPVKELAHDPECHRPHSLARIGSIADRLSGGLAEQDEERSQ
jgi:multiple sugar transport system substrate-binding protein